MNKPTLKAGILGSGFAAAFHFEALKRVYGVQVEVAGVYSPTKENREKYAAEHGIPAFENLEALVDASDVVHVLTPPVSHEEAAIAVLAKDKSAIIEKPFTGYFGAGKKDFSGTSFPREEGLRGATESITNMIRAEQKSKGKILYAENWVYAPAVQKEREIIEKTGSQILWMHGEEAHSGSHSKYYGIWSHSGGGSVIGKAVHPLTAALYLKKVEGRSRGSGPIRPRSVTARVHALTKSPHFKDSGFIRTSYTDIEDFGMLHIVFEDDTIADIFASDIVLGGVHNEIEVVANNHRTICNINPNNSLLTYNPKEEQFSDIYVVEKTGTKQGWAMTSPEEDWFHGYHHEMEAFYTSVAYDQPPESDSQLAADTIAVVYAGYLSAERNGKEVEVPHIS